MNRDFGRYYGDPESAFEFVVEMRDYRDLEWWSAGRRGEVDYYVDYEHMRLRIGVHLAGLAG